MLSALSALGRSRVNSASPTSTKNGLRLTKCLVLPLSELCGSHCRKQSCGRWTVGWLIRFVDEVIGVLAFRHRLVRPGKFYVVGTSQCLGPHNVCQDRGFVQLKVSGWLKRV